MANNGISESTKCTPLFAVHGMDPGMSIAGNFTQDRGRRRLDGDQVQAMIEQFHEHLQVEM